MAINQNVIAGSPIFRRNIPAPISAVCVPFLGLAYIVFLPFAGIIAFVWLLSHNVVKYLATLFHRSDEAILQTQKLPKK